MKPWDQFSAFKKKAILSQLYKLLPSLSLKMKRQKLLEKFPTASNTRTLRNISGPIPDKITDYICSKTWRCALGRRSQNTVYENFLQHTRDRILFRNVASVIISCNLFPYLWQCHRYHHYHHHHQRQQQQVFGATTKTKKGYVWVCIHIRVQNKSMHINEALFPTQQP